MAKGRDVPRGEYRRIEPGLHHFVEASSDRPNVSVSPPPRSLEIAIGAVVRAHLPRSFWPWSTQVGLSATNVVEVVESRVNESGALEVELRACAAGEVVVQVHDYVDAERFGGGPIPRLPNRTLLLRIVVASP